MGDFRRVSERLIHQSQVIGLWEGTFVGPDGEPFTRDVVHHPGAVAVVPVHDDGSTVLVRQYRAPLDRALLEIPAGRLDVDGEALEACAARELREEVGLEAGRIEHLVSFVNSPGFCDEVCHVYLATGLSDVGTSRQGIEEDHMTVEVVSLDDVLGMIADGSIVDSKTIIGLTLAGLRRTPDSTSPTA